MTKEKNTLLDSNPTEEKKQKIEIPKDIIRSKGSFEDFRKSIIDSGTIRIKPLIQKDNFGLEKYNMVTFPETVHKEDLTCIEMNGTFRYITGLNEFAPEVQNINDPEQKEITIKTIRNVVAYLEKVLASNNVNPDDENFWSKVQKVRPDNVEFWNSIKLELTNSIKILDPLNNPNDLILLMAIEAGGFSMVGKSYEDAISMPIPPKFFLERRMISYSKKASNKKLHNKAVALLDKMFDSKYDSLFYISHLIDINVSTFKKSTPHDVVYDFIDDYIDGNGSETNKITAAERFIELCNAKQNDLMLRALVKDAISFRYIIPKPDGSYYHVDTNAYLGKNNADIVAYFNNPTNDNILTAVLKQVEKRWA